MKKSAILTMALITSCMAFTALNGKASAAEPLTNEISVEKIALEASNTIDLSNDPDLKITKISKALYNGAMSAPKVEMTYKSVPLKSSDYLISVDSGITNGKGTGRIIFVGSYSGILPIEFEVEKVAPPITGFTAELTDEGTAISWDKIENCCDYIFVFRQSEKTKAITVAAILKSDSDSYLDTAMPDKEDCTYFIQTNIMVDEQPKFNGSNHVTVTARHSTTETGLILGNGKVTVNWKKSATATGYLVFMDGKQIFDTQSGDVTSYTYTGIRNYERHEFTVKPYTTVDGKTTYGQTSEALSTLGVDSIINSARTTDTRSFTLFNRQGANTATSMVTLTDNDIAILDKFARENFTADMTDAQKLETALTWVNRNTTYARTAADFSKINGKSYVEAIFTYKTGQCAQYNGAMVSLMRYLGYEANLVLGYRGTWKTNYWQHYWGEVEIDGLRYLIEAGNYGSSGSWSYLLTPYVRTDGKFIMNCQNVARDYTFSDYNNWSGWYTWY